MEPIVFLLILVLFVIFIGAICGIASLLSLRGMSRRIASLENELRQLRHPEVKTEIKIEVSEVKPESVAPPAPPPSLAPESPPPIEPSPALETIVPEKPAEIPPPISERRAPSLEQTLGSKWLVWIGMALTLVGAAFFLKYAYDNAWIGPKGRLAIGVFACVVALMLGERFRRKGWNSLFQTLTGGAVAGFYVSIYFSFQIYHLSGQQLAFGLAILTTCFAMGMSVIHNAPAIAVLSLLGGFASPVLLSTGANHPHFLFIYIALLDLMVLGVAYYRRWRILDVLAFVGTSLIYQGWFYKFYGSPNEPSQMLPALLYASIFYVLFLLIPIFHGIARRVAEKPENIALLAINVLYTFIIYYRILFAQHREILAFVVIGQAILIFLLFRIWMQRMKSERGTAEALLIIGLALVTVAIPIRLRMYAVPIAWALEGAFLMYLHRRFARRTLQWAGLAGLALAVGGLLMRLPLHKVAFMPLINAPFGSWALVIAALSLSAYLIYFGVPGRERKALTAILILAAFALLWLLLSMETVSFWEKNTTLRPRLKDVQITSSLLILWIILSLSTHRLILNYKRHDWMPLVYVCFVLCLIMNYIGLTFYFDNKHQSLVLNDIFPLRLLFPIALWLAGGWMGQKDMKPSKTVFSVVGHFSLTILIAAEIMRWSRYSDVIGSRMAIGLVSAAWALQALILVGLGFFKRDRALRYMGIALFALTIAKVTIVDMSALEKVYRIVSFVGSGLLLLVAGYCYNRFSPMLLKEEKGEVNQ